MSETDRIVRTAVLRAPRVWRAITIAETGFDGIPLARRAKTISSRSSRNT